MIELIVLNDRAPGRRFQMNAAPVRLGRRPDLEVVLSDAGVWDKHAEIVGTDEGWFLIRALGHAHVTVNAQTITEHRLRNADVVGVGAVKLQFSLRSSPQRSLKVYEMAVWILIAGITCLALALILAIGK